MSQLRFSEEGLTYIVPEAESSVPSAIGSFELTES